jgi:hypothetical protein
MDIVERAMVKVVIRSGENNRAAAGCSHRVSKPREFTSYRAFPGPPPLSDSRVTGCLG